MRPHRWQPTRLPRPWDSPGKNTGVGCHFLLQCMKVESESEVARSGLTLSDPVDCSLPGSSIRGLFQARVLEWGAIAFSTTSTYWPSIHFLLWLPPCPPPPTPTKWCSWHAAITQCLFAGLTATVWVFWILPEVVTAGRLKISVPGWAAAVFKTNIQVN